MTAVTTVTSAPDNNPEAHALAPTSRSDALGKSLGPGFLAVRARATCVSGLHDSPRAAKSTSRTRAELRDKGLVKVPARRGAHRSTENALQGIGKPTRRSPLPKP